jgi:hypothetical protein
MLVAAVVILITVALKLIIQSLLGHKRPDRLFTLLATADSLATRIARVIQPAISISFQHAAEPPASRRQTKPSFES